MCSKSQILLSLLLVLAGCLCAAKADARTWRVAKDGSGDFSVIQDAVNAAADGDTVSVGAGRYEEAEWWEFPSATSLFHVVISQAELTLIGDDTEAVVIGANAFTGTYQGPYGISCPPGSAVTLEGLTVEHCYSGVVAEGDSLVMEGCAVRNCVKMGIHSLSLLGIEVSSCEFSGNDLAGIILFGGLGSAGSAITNCRFSGNKIGLDLQTHDNVVTSCLFENGEAGLQVSFGGTATVTSCQFGAGLGPGLGLVNGSRATVRDCTFAPAEDNVLVRTGSWLEGRNCIFAGGSYATVRLTVSSDASLENCHILNAGGWSVVVSGYVEPDRIYDFGNNYWGTTSSEQISEWIHDGNDDPSIPGFVVFEPFLGQPTPTETISFGTLRARFGTSQ